MLKKIALIVVMFILPLGAMAQAKFAHMNSQEVITVMPEFTKAQADLDAMSKEYQEEMQRTNEEFQKKYQAFLTEQDSLPKNIAERRQKELQEMAQRQEEFQQEAYQSMQKAQQDAMAPSTRSWMKRYRLWVRQKAWFTSSISHVLPSHISVLQVWM